MRHRRYDHLELSDSPNTASLMALIGEEKLAQLSLDFGGSVISIPLKAGENSPITYSIGLDAAQMLSDIWGGMSFEVPARIGKKARAVRMIRDGKPVNLIVRLTGLSRREVYRLLKKEEDQDQLNMF